MNHELMNVNIRPLSFQDTIFRLEFRVGALSTSLASYHDV